MLYTTSSLLLIYYDAAVVQDIAVTLNAKLPLASCPPAVVT